MLQNVERTERTMKMTIAIAACILLAGSAPVSASSVLDSTPFAEREQATTSVDRVNLWPFFYYQAPSWSLLWPIVDRREDGHAVRPLYAIYGQELYVLWPLSSFDFAKHEHRVLSAWWNPGEAIVFPFYFYEKDKYWIAIPVAGRGKDWYSIAPPMWVRWYERPDRNGFFAFPFYYNRHGTAYECSFAGELYYQTRNDKWFFQSVFPLWFWEETPEKTYMHALPLFFRGRTPKEDWWTLLPLFYSRQGEKSLSRMMLPAFFYSRDETSALLITPLFGTLMGDDVERVITPLVSRSRRGDDRFVNLMGPLFNHAWNEKTGFDRKDIAWPFSTFKCDGKETTTSILPLVYYTSDEHGYKSISAVSSGRRDDGSGFFNVLGLLFHRGWKSKENETYTHVCWPLYARGQSDKKFETYSFPFFRYARDERGKEGFIFWPLYSCRLGKDGSTRQQFLALCEKSYEPLHKSRYSYHRELLKGPPAPRTSVWVFPLSRYLHEIRYEENRSVEIPPELKGKNGDKIDPDKAIAAPDAWNSFAQKRWKPCEYTQRVMFPFWESESKKDISSSAELLFYVYRSDWTAAAGSTPEKTRRSILWRVMRYEKTGEDVSLDVFPFITYDARPAEKLTQFSVFWRLYRKRTEGDKTALDVLGIPVRR